MPLAACSRPAPIVVVSAGVFGAWTAEHLRRKGKDAEGTALNARFSLATKETVQARSVL